MNIFDSMLTVLKALWAHDYLILSDPKLVTAFYIMLFIILFLENGVLPAAFLPGDTLLILSGVLVSNENVEMTLVGTLFALILGAGLGTWFGYIQGRWLGNTSIIQSWLSHLPEKHHQRAQLLFFKHGLAALFISRFIAFVRTLLPILTGVAKLSNARFHLYNWLSATLWVVLLVGAGYLVGETPIFKRYEDNLMSILIIIPCCFVFLGIVGSLYVVIKNKMKSKD